MPIYAVMLFALFAAALLRWFLRRSAINAVYAAGKTPCEEIISDKMDGSGETGQESNKSEEKEEAEKSDKPALCAVRNDPPEKTIIDAVDREVVAWIRGGPMRVMELWFARLVLTGLVTSERGRFENHSTNNSSVVHTIHEETVSPDAMSFFENQAFSTLPSSGQTTSLRHIWRRSLRRLQVVLVKNNILLMPDRRRFKLYRLLMLCLFFLHFFVLLQVSAGFSLWILSVVFWTVLSPFLFFMHLKLPLNPHEVSRVEAFECGEGKKKEDLENMNDVLTHIALFGAPDLLETKWEHAILAAPLLPWWRVVF